MASAIPLTGSTTNPPSIDRHREDPKARADNRFAKKNSGSGTALAAGLGRELCERYGASRRLGSTLIDLVGPNAEQDGDFERFPIAVDTHPQTPTAVLFVAVAPTGQIFFSHELWIGGIKKDRITEVCGEIKQVTKNLRIGYELLEPAAW